MNFSTESEDTQDSVMANVVPLRPESINSAKIPGHKAHTKENTQILRITSNDNFFNNKSLKSKAE